MLQEIGTIVAMLAAIVSMFFLGGNSPFLIGTPVPLVGICILGILLLFTGDNAVREFNDSSFWKLFYGIVAYVSGAFIVFASWATVFGFGFEVISIARDVIVTGCFISISLSLYSVAVVNKIQVRKEVPTIA